ncbi:tyrosine-type recombinase/integrase [Saccharothrix sp. HUAS TT1]|uniref:tyrosine-type recombinase/integrase n=1 Tax=unclassified Saccharothrix TaxID=2593673 RepID=UPI00345BE91B
MAPQDLWLKSDGERSARYGVGKRWRVNYNRPDGTPGTKAFARKTDAIVFENNIKADLSRGQFIDPAAGKMTVREFGETWARNKKAAVDPATALLIERGLRLHIYPILGGEPLFKLVNSDIQSWVTDRAQVLQPVTLRATYHLVLQPLLSAAVIDKKIGSSPCVAIKLPKRLKRPYHIPPASKVHALSKALPERYRAAPWLAAGCGLRPAEVLGLEDGAVAFLNEEVDVVQQVKYIPRRGQYLALPKTKLVRTVDLPAVVAEAVTEQLRVAPPIEYELDDETDQKAIRIDRSTGERRVPRRKTQLLFSTSTGKPLYTSDFSKMWIDAVAAAELPKGFRFHDLRHFFATSLIHNGASVETVRLTLGHATLKTTFETYVHEWPDLKEQPRSIMDRVLARAR